MLFMNYSLYGESLITYKNIKLIVPLLAYLIVESSRYLHHKYSKHIKIAGLMAAISYLIVILYTWISANFLGYEYFSAGETHKIIKYIEWLIGVNSIIVLGVYLRNEMRSI